MILQLLFCWKSWGCFLGQPRDTPVHSHADTWQRSRWAVRAVYVHIKANYHAGVLVLTWTSDWCSCLLSLISREVTVHPQRRLMKYVAWLGQFHDASFHVENPTESGWPQIANLLIYFVEEAIHSSYPMPSSNHIDELHKLNCKRCKAPRHNWRATQFRQGGQDPFGLSRSQ